MRLDPRLVTADDIASALSEELLSPPRLLPPSVVDPALLSRQDDVAKWVHDQITGSFTPTPEEIVAVNKGRHGVRPVAVWDFPSRLAYAALAARLSQALPPAARTRGRWREFQRAPLSLSGDYVLVADIASCYDQIDHGLLSRELLARTGDHASVTSLVALLQQASGRTYGLPQQSRASDVVAEPFLDRLERGLIRRGLQVARYSDDFRFSCNSWPEVVRAMEVLAEEARLLGLTVNDAKTVTWKRNRYVDSLDVAEELRRQIADDAELDLTDYESDPYDAAVVSIPPEQSDVDELAAKRILERWAKVAGRGVVAARRRAEHRAVLDLVPFALVTLTRSQQTDVEVLAHCMKLLRFERTMTPDVGKYLINRNDDHMVLGAFDQLLRARSYLNGWQTWWLQQPVARLSDFATGAGSQRRLKWAQNALTNSEHSPVLRAHAALTLARHRRIKVDELLSLYDRSSTTVRPVLVAAMALLKPQKNIQRAVTDDSQLHKWVYQWSATSA